MINKYLIKIINNKIKINKIIKIVLNNKLAKTFAQHFVQERNCIHYDLL